MVKTAKRRTGAENKLARIEKCLTAIENCRWSDLSLSYCIDYIVWCRKWKKITEEKFTELANRIIAIQESGLERFYE